MLAEAGPAGGGGGRRVRAENQPCAIRFAVPVRLLLKALLLTDRAALGISICSAPPAHAAAAASSMSTLPPSLPSSWACVGRDLEEERNGPEARPRARVRYLYLTNIYT